MLLSFTPFGGHLLGQFQVPFGVDLCHIGTLVASAHLQNSTITWSMLKEWPFPCTEAASIDARSARTRAYSFLESAELYSPR